MALIAPYYSDDAVTIYHGDCRDILPHLPKVDLVLTDPPYGNSTEYGCVDDTPEALTSLVLSSFGEIRGRCERMLITTGTQFMWLYPRPDWTLSWVVPSGSGCGPWGFCCWQPILAYGKDPYLVDGRGSRPDTLIRCEASEKNGHPCPKPLGVWKWVLIRGSSRQTDTILDPFMGSGTTLRAAKDLGRKAIGIEIEERYCEIAAKRMAQEVLL